MKHSCLQNLVRLGRANYQCDICKKDMSLELVFLFGCIGEKEFNKVTRVVKTNEITKPNN